MNATETVYKAMGWQHVGGHVWHSPDRLGAFRADPLADTPEGWWEFGQILEWAEKWSDEHEFRFQVTRTWEYIDGRSQRCYDVTVTHGRTMLARIVALTFRAAFIEALAEAAGGQG